MLIRRSTTSLFRKHFKPGKVVVLYGPRRVGKTTIAKSWMKEMGEKVLWVNGDELKYRDLFARQGADELTQFIGNYKTIVIDEAQRLPEIGINLKLITDTMPQVRILATGSSAFELAEKVSEPLTGRKHTVWLYPLNYIELERYYGAWHAKQKIAEHLVWGGYPEVLLAKSAQDKQDTLREIVNSYLYRDVLAFEGVRKSDKVVELLRLLAWQIGSEVSVNELATKLGMNRVTIERYLELLEKSFVIYRLGGFSRNLRKEISKSSKYYFVDNGVRNALVEEFKPLSLRNDAGQLWENWVMMERRKWWSSRGVVMPSYFWRTYDQQEIDLVEESDGELRGYELKWNADKVKVPVAWKKEYDKATFEVINRNNFDKNFVQNVNE